MDRAARVDFVDGRGLANTGLVPNLDEQAAAIVSHTPAHKFHPGLDGWGCAPPAHTVHRLYDEREKGRRGERRGRKRGAGNRSHPAGPGTTDPKCRGAHPIRMACPRAHTARQARRDPRLWGDSKRRHSPVRTLRGRHRTRPPSLPIRISNRRGCGGCGRVGWGRASHQPSKALWVTRSVIQGPGGGLARPQDRQGRQYPQPSPPLRSPRPGTRVRGLGMFCGD